MFVSQARSITQQSRLAITLAWVAGYTNILSLITCGTATSHVSGTLSQWGLDLVEGKWALMAFTSFLLACFFTGAVVSALCTETGRRRGWQSIYVLPMALQAVLLAAFAGCIEWTGREAPSTPLTYLITGLASAAMGLQNATITRISGGVVRTTHMTGVVTDLGLESVQCLYWLKDRAAGVVSPARVPTQATAPPTGRRLLLLLSIAGSFAMGAGLGAAAHRFFPQEAMVPPVLFLVWIIYQDIRTPICDLAPSELIDEDLGLPRGICAFGLKRRDGSGRRFHRLPDLQRWLESLPSEARVAILDLGDAVTLDENTALELASLATQATAQGRRVIFAGVGPSQFRVIQRAGVGDVLDQTNLSPDLELAVARGLHLLESLGRPRD